NGIGPAIAAKLNDLGIKDIATLAAQDDPASLAELIGGRGVSADTVSAWIAEAKGGAADSDGGSAASAPTTNPGPFGGKGDHDGDGKTGGAKAQTVPVRINRDFWDTEGVRQRKGNVIEVTIEEAFNGLESGALSRVK